MNESGIERGPSLDYNVVLKTKDSGVITWTSYESQADFDAARGKLEKNYTVVDQGISVDACIAHCRRTAPAAYTREAFLSATDAQGHLHTDLLSHELEKSAFGIQISDTPEI